MKTQISKKRIKDYYKTIIIIPYCDAQHLLKGIQPTYYTAGIYGWNTDIYTLYPVAIQTGYRDFINTGITPDHDLIKKYDDAAREVYEARTEETWQERNDKINALLDKFIQEVRKP